LLVDQVSSGTAGSVERGVGLLLAQICRAHRNLVASALDEIRVHVGQDHFVHRLAIEEGVTQSQLADALCVDASTVTKTLARLERDGVVERTPDAGDARVSRVYLTPRGRTLVRPVADVWARAEERLVKEMSEAERALLRRLLMQVLDNLS
jgi:DNA-binding MarR family transcriptional regulator